MADNRAKVAATFTTTDTGSTDWLMLSGNKVDGRNFFDVSIQDDTDGTFQVDLERKRESEADGSARLIKSYTADAEEIGEIQGTWLVRLTVSDHTSSSSLVCEVSRS